MTAFITDDNKYRPMKKWSIILMIAGIVVIICGQLIFRNLNYINPVDSHAWTININGINSFPWVVFSGFLLLTLGMIFYISSWKQTGKRIS